MSSEREREGEEVIEQERGRERQKQGIGGLRVFRLIGGQRSASPPARTDS